MAYPIPTLDESEEIAVAAFRALFPGRNISAKRSFHRRRMQFMSALLTELHAHLSSAQEDVMPDSATGTFATRWGDALGTDEKGATPARKSSALRVVGDVVGSPIPAGSTLTHVPSGLRFQIPKAYVLPAEEQIDVDVVAIDTGSITRLTKGEVLMFDSTPAGLQTPAELQLDLDEDGQDAELESAFKRRYLDRMGEPSAGGNAADYVEWLEAVTGIAVGYCYPNRAGRGTVDVVAFHAGTGADRVLLDSERDDLLAALQPLGPTQVVTAALRVLITVPDQQNVEITVEPNGAPENEFDWDDSTPLVISVYDPDALTIKFTTNLPASMKAGDRIVVHGVASSQDGAPLVIDSLVAADTIKLEVAPDSAPAATDVVYAGGPLTSVIRDAILAHMTGDLVYAGDNGPIPGAIAESQPGGTVGLKIIAEPIGPANPGSKYGTWSGGLLRAVLQQIAVSPRGARNASCLVPAADYEATDFAFPDDLQIGFITPGELLIRKAW